MTSFYFLLYLPQQPYFYLFLLWFLQSVVPSLVPGYVCQQVSRHFFLSAHRTPPLTSPHTRTHSSVFFLNSSSDFLVQATITSPSLYFITTPDFQATSQSLEIC
uniref:Uncharacterized protein n=1 Tax=Salix viminalis TaxID=40686 RepID=A0A6N2L9B8_SALVM